MTPAEAAFALESVRRSAGSGSLRVVAGTDVDEAVGEGLALRRMRHEQDLSMAQVAEALILKEHQVAAIEAMDFSRLPGLGYALGYVRGYAELLKAPDVEGIVDRFRAAWEPTQNAQEKAREVQTRRFAAPVMALVAAGALTWLLGWAAVHAIMSGPKDEIAPPDAAIQAWATDAPALSARGAAVVEPRTVLRALRPVRAELRGADGALVIDRTLRANEEISTDGLGQWFVSTTDAGALEAAGFGVTVAVGEAGEKVDWWRVPDLALMADQAAKAAADAATEAQPGTASDAAAATPVATAAGAQPALPASAATTVTPLQASPKAAPQVPAIGLRTPQAQAPAAAPAPQASVGPAPQPARLAASAATAPIAPVAAVRPDWAPIARQQ